MKDWVQTQRAHWFPIESGPRHALRENSTPATFGRLPSVASACTVRLKKRAAFLRLSESISSTSTLRLRAADVVQFVQRRGRSSGCAVRLPLQSVNMKSKLAAAGPLGLHCSAHSSHAAVPALHLQRVLPGSRSDTAPLARTRVVLPCCDRGGHAGGLGRPGRRAYRSS